MKVALTSGGFNGQSTTKFFWNKSVDVYATANAQFTFEEEIYCHFIFKLKSNDIYELLIHNDVRQVNPYHPEIFASFPNCSLQLIHKGLSFGIFTFFEDIL